MARRASHTASLFGPADDAVPDGLRYRPDFISADEERELVTSIGHLEFSPYELRGVVAKRRVAVFGRSYVVKTEVPPIPAFLMSLRASLARWAGIRPDAFAMALINEYTPGTPIVWHRDAPQHGIVAGVSLLSACRMKFRPYVPPARRGAQIRTATHELLLARRSAYLLTGPARHDYEHHIPPVSALRYSITFRTVRGNAV
jgi:hypothetical protein